MWCSGIFSLKSAPFGATGGNEMPLRRGLPWNLVAIGREEPLGAHQPGEGRQRATDTV